MSCSKFELQIVSDDPVEQERGARHADECEHCAAVLSAHQRLSERAKAWRRSYESPPELELRVRRALTIARPAPARLRSTEATGDRGLRLWPLGWPRGWAKGWTVPALVAAGLLTVLAIGWPLLHEPAGPEVTRRLLAAQALQQAQTAERQHARAIARLERAAAPMLKWASDPDAGPEQVGLLLAYADRLAFLDSTIEQVEAYIDENPTHPHSRITLLAAYREKTEILGQILTLETTS